MEDQRTTKCDGNIAEGTPDGDHWQSNAFVGRAVPAIVPSGGASTKPSTTRGGNCEETDVGANTNKNPAALKTTTSKKHGCKGTLC